MSTSNSRTENAVHHVEESVEHGLNKIKQYTVGSSVAGDTAKETYHKAQNRASEVKTAAKDHIDDIQNRTPSADTTGTDSTTSKSAPSVSQRINRDGQE